MGRGPGPEKTEGVAVRLLVVRHGNTFLPGEVSRWLGSESDPPLAPQAKEQAIRVRELLKKKDLCPTVAYAGPLRRHQEFIGLLLEGRLCPWAIDERLQELDYGRWAGMKQEEIREQGELTDWNDHCVWPPSAGWAASEAEIRAEMRGFVNELFVRHPGETVLLVSSNGRLRLLAKEYASKNWPDKSFKLKTGHVGLLEVRATGAEIRFWNE